MNYHSDEWVMDQLNEHYINILKLYPKERIVFLALQGSQSYGLDYEGSDVDTKVILTPSFKDIAMNRKPISTTHIRENDEHIDAKDIRLYMETFRKQNLNFLEILFTPYSLIFAKYFKQWTRLIDNREAIARMNPYRAVKSMKGIAAEKYHAMKHPYPSKIELIEKIGYDGKQVSHLLRIEDYLERYIAGEPYEDCLHPRDEIKHKLMDYKRQKISLTVAERDAYAAMLHIDEMEANFCVLHKNEEDPVMRGLLEDVQYEIMKIAVKSELEEEESQCPQE